MKLLREAKVSITTQRAGGAWRVIVEIDSLHSEPCAAAMAEYLEKLLIAASPAQLGSSPQ